MNKFKARITTYCDLSDADVLLFNIWPCTGTVKYALKASIRVAVATHHGEPVVFVTFVSVPPAILITSFRISPFASPQDAQLSGDAIDGALERFALQAGSRNLVLSCSNMQIEALRTYNNSQSAPTFSEYTPSRVTYLN
jgi:hypothetical protein